MSANLPEHPCHTGNNERQSPCPHSLYHTGRAVRVNEHERAEEIIPAEAQIEKADCEARIDQHGNPRIQMRKRCN